MSEHRNKGKGKGKDKGKGKGKGKGKEKGKARPKRYGNVEDGMKVSQVQTNTRLRANVPQYKRKRGRRSSTGNEKLLQMLKPSEKDVMKMLAAQTHIGRRKCHVNMMRYIWKRRADGVYVINLEKTWAKMVLAARIMVTVREPADIAVMSTRTMGQRGAIKFAHYTGATAMVGKWVPGTFTNPRNKTNFAEPRLLIVDDPVSCFAALRETSYTGIPVIALMGTDTNSRFVDCAIPCNNRGKFSIGLMFWLLTRELLRMRGKSDYECIRSVPWKESVDLFFYRDADEIKRQQDAKQRKLDKAARAQQQQEPYQQQAEDLDYGQQQQFEQMDDAAQQQQFGDVQQPMDVGYDLGGQDQGYGAPQDWDMPQGQEIEDWDQQDQGYGAPQQMDQMDQAMVPQDAQQIQQQPQYGDQGGYEQPQAQGGYADPNDNAAMGMQNW